MRTHRGNPTIIVTRLRNYARTLLSIQNRKSIRKKRKSIPIGCVRTYNGNGNDRRVPSNNAQIINSPLAIPGLTSLPARPIVSFQYNNFYWNDPTTVANCIEKAVTYFCGIGRHCSTISIRAISVRKNSSGVCKTLSMLTFLKDDQSCTTNLCHTIKAKL